MRHYCFKVTLMAALFLAVPALGQELIRVAEFGRGSASVVNDQLSPSDALSQFFLDYDDTDHHVRELAVLKNGRNRVLGTLADSGGDKPMGFSAHYRRVGGSILLSRTTRCRGFCRIPLQGLRPGVELALAGFKFKRIQGGDSHVKSVGIMPHTDGRSVDVHFKDNAAFDYEVTIQYQLVQARFLSAIGEASGDELVRVVAASNLPKVISGFSFFFGTFDHHLLEIGVNLNNASVSVDFRDNNARNPMGWRVRYLVLDD